MQLSEDTKERIVRIIDVAKTVVHYGWVPFVIYVGFMSSSPRPNLFKILSPLS
ncbi:Component of the TOM (translocase of outer membrane) complex [Malassezia sympodialis ATCC 42132]|uniref:Component of the TOM (Translocase of outer membrane) complex n=1 Tax=Malassezia sympodialis (strain ATCC 42132) TaxID=1230383 RepID=A0A1M8A0A3_MALS4|nr:Component of the TOM (translocase of outer membrane) complex [Malassezia sympodialis ATCC 42132]